MDHADEIKANMERADQSLQRECSKIRGKYKILARMK
jgi:hypothetical protein